MKFKHRFFFVVLLLSLSASAAFAQQRRRSSEGEVIPNPSERDRTRDEWQRPAEVLDALGLQAGQRVADIGCGAGYFAFHLAARVGETGEVFAVDIDAAALKKLQARQASGNIKQIKTILGESADPKLPNDLDAVLIVDTYHEFREYEQTMQAVRRALKPGGRLVIIDGEGPADRPRTEYHRLHVIPAELVKTEVARQGFIFKESLAGFYDAEYDKRMYFLVFVSATAQKSNTENQATVQRLLSGR